MFNIITLYEIALLQKENPTRKNEKCAAPLRGSEMAPLRFNVSIKMKMIRKGLEQLRSLDAPEFL